MQNTIRRELTINATAEPIYHAIAMADQVVKWFPDKVEGDFNRNRFCRVAAGDCRQQFSTKQ